MRYEVSGRNGFVPSEAIKQYAEKRFSKVVAFFGPDVVHEVRVVCKIYKDRHKVEVTIPTKSNILRAEAADVDMYAAIDKANDKLIAQIRRFKDRLKSNLEKEGVGQVFSKEFDAEELEKEVLAAQLVKNKEVELIAMTPEEAITAMELLNHSFYVFLDKETGRTNVVYRRHDGDYAVIETKEV